METDNTFIRFDWAIKHMLRDKSNFEILEGLLTVLLGEEVKIKQILESEANQESATDKFNRVDIKAENSKGHIILVEVQLTREFDYLHRILYGTCKTITDHMQLGERYDKVKKVYSISILYCDYGRGDDYVYVGEMDFRGLHTGTELIVSTKEDGVIVQRLPKDIYPVYYILRVNSFDKIPTSPLDEWMSYLKTGKVKEDTSAPGLQRVREKLRVLLMTKEQRQAYDRHLDNIMVQNDVLDTARTEGREEGFAEGKAEGRAEGLAEGKAEGLAEGLEKGMEKGREDTNYENARKMLAMNFPKEAIMEVTGLSPEQLASLEQE